MSTYKDQTTQVMAMTWNVTEHMIFLRSLAVICNFSHWKDNAQSMRCRTPDTKGYKGVRALQMGKSGFLSPPLFPDFMNSPNHQKSFSLNHLASTRYQAMVLGPQPTFDAMKRSWDQDEL